MASRTVEQVIDEHRGAGRRFEAGGVGSFVRELGDGEPVVLLHGVPTSSFLYRKMLAPLARAGLRAIAFDLPGLGLAERPPDFDYRWGGLASWIDEAMAALDVDRAHLVVHDIGGPIGVEWAAHNPGRVRSLTALNTFVDVAGFRPPWSMRPFRTRFGPAYLATMTRRSFAALFYVHGVGNRWAVPREEAWAHHDLLKGADRGAAFLRIMRGFELTRVKQDLLSAELRGRAYPAQVVWGKDDPALGDDHRAAVEKALGVESSTLLPAKHFLQEDQAIPVAVAVADLARSA